MFSVVEFISKNKRKKQISVVPDKWIRGDETYWPSMEIDISNIYLNKDPDPNWKTFKISILKGHGKLKFINIFTNFKKVSKHHEVYYISQTTWVNAWISF